MSFLTYDCALEGTRRPPITVTVTELAERRAIAVRRLGHQFTLEVEPRTRKVYCIYQVAWGKSGRETARIHVGVNARFH